MGWESMPDKDSIDREIAHWKRELPDLDQSIEGAVTRMQLLVRRLQQIKKQTVAAHGLKDYEYDIIWHLRSLGSPYRATPTLLAQRLDTHPATLTSRMDRLQETGYVTRLHDASDRRRLLIALTPQGHQLWEATIGEELAAERTLMAVLTRQERKQLSDLLRKVVLAAEAQGSTLIAADENRA
jgi:DNA-binding MarR family transcriptional regulator